MPCIYHIKRFYADVFFAVITVNSWERYSSSFSGVLCMCIVWWIMSGKHQENERFSVHVFHPHRLKWGLGLNVCVVHCQVLPPLPLQRKRPFLFLYFWQKKLLLYRFLVIEWREPWRWTSLCFAVLINQIIVITVSKCNLVMGIFLIFSKILLMN